MFSPPQPEVNATYHAVFLWGQMMKIWIQQKKIHCESIMNKHYSKHSEQQQQKVPTRM